jgi:hypothetical protein
MPRAPSAADDYTEVAALSAVAQAPALCCPVGERARVCMCMCMFVWICVYLCVYVYALMCM